MKEIPLGRRKMIQDQKIGKNKKKSGEGGYVSKPKWKLTVKIIIQIMYLTICRIKIDDNNYTESRREEDKVKVF